jgi:protein involved in polysaccharide export with SLBB domain
MASEAVSGLHGVITLALILALVMPGLAQVPPPQVPGPLGAPPAAPGAPQAPPGQSAPPPQPSAPAPPSLPQYGSDLLEQRPPSPAVALERAVGSTTYMLGPGDRLAIHIWRPGKPPNTFDLTVPLEGRLFLPVLGDVRVAGLTIAQVKQRIDGLLRQRLRAFEATILLTGLRSFRILLIGEVQRPGYLTATAVTRLSEVIAETGVNPIGSMRTIEVRTERGERHTVDLYRFLARGSVPDNPLIAEGLTITVQRRFATVEIRGAVGRPGRYELKRGETLKDLLFYAGGPTTDAYRPRLHLVRIDERSPDAPRQLVTLSLDGALAGRSKENPTLRDQDAVTVFSVMDLSRGDIVTIQGAVRSPGEFPVASGMRVRDALLLAGGPRPDALMERVELFRLKPGGSSVENREVIQLNVEQALRDPQSPANLPLRPGDVLVVYSLSQFRGSKVRIAGAVRTPGEYELVTDMRVRDLLFRAGGLLPDADLEQVQLERAVNNEKAVLPLNLVKLLLDGDESQNVRLQFDDVVIVPSMLALARVVFVEGRVRKPGGYPWRANETVSTLLVRAGGPVLEEERPVAASQDAQAASAQALAPADLRAAYIERTSTDGRKAKVGVDLHRLIVVRDPGADVRLQPGDVLILPARIQQVYVQGIVEKSGGFAFEPNRTVRHYLGLAAPRKTANLSKVLLRRLDGSFVGGLDTAVQPGDVIIVPEQRAWEVLNILGILAPVIQLIFGR